MVHYSHSHNHLVLLSSDFIAMARLFPTLIVSRMVQVMAVAPSMDAAGDATRVPAHTSDLIELVSGVCQVRCHDATGMDLLDGSA